MIYLILAFLTVILILLCPELLWVIPLLLFLPDLRCLVKRLQLRHKLNRLCAKKNIPLSGTHRFWHLGRRTAPSCDFSLEHDGELLAVKLFSVRRKSHTLVFLPREDRYALRRKKSILYASVSWLHLPFLADSHPLPAYRFDVPNPRNLPRRNLLLIHPACGDILLADGKEETILGSGDRIGDMELISLSRLLDMLS